MVVFNANSSPVFKETVSPLNFILLTGVPTVIRLDAFIFVPLILAVIVVFPFFFAVTFPFPDTDATLGLLLFQITACFFVPEGIHAALPSVAFNFMLFPFLKYKPSCLT